MGCRSPAARSGVSLIARRLTFKKTAHASEQDRPDVAERRSAWFDAQPDLDPERLVFIDETGASTKIGAAAGAGHREANAVAPPCPTAIG